MKLLPPEFRATFTQLLRYGLIGVGTNAAGYLVYLGVTHLGFAPKMTKTFFYFVGATVGFFGNKNLSFSFEGNSYRAALRYIIAHSLGYSVNLLLLTVFVDWYHYPHQWVQGIAILVVAVIIFVLFKFFVFPAPTKQAAGTGAQLQ